MSLTETLLDALNASRTTIVFGNVGRYRDALEHALSPHVVPIDDDEDENRFLYQSRVVTLLVEPPFGFVLDPQQHLIVLTSHLDLVFDPRHTRIVTCHMPTLQTTAPNDRYIGQAFHVDTDDPHEAYLSILTRSETTPRPWHIVMKQATRRRWKAPLERSMAQCRKLAVIKDETLLNHYFEFV